MRIEETIDISAPPEKVWSVMVDVERWPEWTSSVTSVQLLNGPTLAVGSRARIRQPRLVPAIWTVTELEAGRYFEWRNVQFGLTSIGRHRVVPLDSDSSRAILSLVWTGWLTPLINIAFGGLSRRYVQTEANGLKRRSEALTGG